MTRSCIGIGQDTKYTPSGMQNKMLVVKYVYLLIRAIKSMAPNCCTKAWQQLSSTKSSQTCWRTVGEKHHVKKNAHNDYYFNFILTAEERLTIASLFVLFTLNTLQLKPYNRQSRRLMARVVN